MIRPGAAPRMVLPRPARGAPELGQALDLIERADAENAKLNREVKFFAVLLIAPNLQVYRLSVDNNGQLRTELVARA